MSARVSTVQRASSLPDVPAYQPTPFRATRVTGWLGIGAPKGTPAELSKGSNKEINAALADQTFAARLRRDRQRAASRLVRADFAENSSPPKPKNGARWSNSPALRRIDRTH